MSIFPTKTEREREGEGGGGVEAGSRHVTGLINYGNPPLETVQLPDPVKPDGGIHANIRGRRLIGDAHEIRIFTVTPREAAAG